MLTFTKMASAGETLVSEGIRDYTLALTKERASRAGWAQVTDLPTRTGACSSLVSQQSES